MILGFAACDNNKPTENGKMTTTASEIKTAVKTDSTSNAQVFVCPMHPEVTGKEGDKCSKCGMALVHKE